MRATYTRTNRCPIFSVFGDYLENERAVEKSSRSKSTSWGQYLSFKPPIIKIGQVRDELCVPHTHAHNQITYFRCFWDYLENEGAVKKSLRTKSTSRCQYLSFKPSVLKIGQVSDELCVPHTHMHKQIPYFKGFWGLSRKRMGCQKIIPYKEHI